MKAASTQTIYESTDDLIERLSGRQWYQLSVPALLALIPVCKCGHRLNRHVVGRINGTGKACIECRCTCFRDAITGAHYPLVRKAA